MKTAVVFLVLAGLMLLSGCGGKSEVTVNTETDIDYGLISVGFSQLGAESDWRVANTNSIRNSLSRENGFDLVFDDAQQKQDKQILAIRKFIQQEMDCIVLAPVTETGWDTVLKEAKDAGIPVIVVDRRVDVSGESLFTAWVGSDFEKEGRIACEWLRSFAEAKKIDQKSLNIVDIQGTLGATAQIGRTRPLEKAADENGWNLLELVPADYTKAKGKEVMENLLEKYPDINVVYCENDNEALGALEALEEAGKRPGTDIKNGEILVISFDAAASGLGKVLEGKIALDVECNPLQGESVRKILTAIKTDGDYKRYNYVSESVFSIDETVKSVELDGEQHDITMITDRIISLRGY